MVKQPVSTQNMDPVVSTHHTVTRKPVIKPKLSAQQQQAKKAGIYESAGITPPPVQKHLNGNRNEYESTSSTPNYTSTPVNEKPPTHPNSVSPASTNSGNGSYALLSM